MKLHYITILFFGISILGCTYDNVEELSFDCETSNLSLNAGGLVAAACDSEGAVTFEALGGVGPYLFSIDSVLFQSVSTYALSAGNYEAFVEDANGCVSSVSFEIAAAEGTIALSIENTENATCDDNQGVISAIATGGIEPYTFRIDDGDFGTETLFSNVPAGVHTVEARDGAGCETSQTTIMLRGTSWANDVKPIIDEFCTGCHGAGGQSPNLSVFSSVQAAASVVRSETQSRSMPQSSSLTQAQIDLIACWVDDGARDN